MQQVLPFAIPVVKDKLSSFWRLWFASVLRLLVPWTFVRLLPSSGSWIAESWVTGPVPVRVDISEAVRVRALALLPRANRLSPFHIQKVRIVT